MLFLSSVQSICRTPMPDKQGKQHQQQQQQQQQRIPASWLLRTVCVLTVCTVNLVYVVQRGAATRVFGGTNKPQAVRQLGSRSSVDRGHNSSSVSPRQLGSNSSLSPQQLQSNSSQHDVGGEIAAWTTEHLLARLKAEHQRAQDPAYVAQLRAAAATPINVVIMTSLFWTHQEQNRTCNVAGVPVECRVTKHADQVCVGTHVTAKTSVHAGRQSVQQRFVHRVWCNCTSSTLLFGCLLPNTAAGCH